MTKLTNTSIILCNCNFCDMSNRDTLLVNFKYTMYYSLFHYHAIVRSPRHTHRIRNDLNFLTKNVIPFCVPSILSLATTILYSVSVDFLPLMPHRSKKLLSFDTWLISLSTVPSRFTYTTQHQSNIMFNFCH